MQDVSIVIPTLGGNSLKNTIFSQKFSSCTQLNYNLHTKNYYNKNNFKFDDTSIEILQTDVIGQVAQRAEGFKNQGVVRRRLMTMFT